MTLCNFIIYKNIMSSSYIKISNIFIEDKFLEME